MAYEQKDNAHLLLALVGTGNVLIGLAFAMATAGPDTAGGGQLVALLFIGWGLLQKLAGCVGWMLSGFRWK